MRASRIAGALCVLAALLLVVSLTLGRPSGGLVAARPLAHPLLWAGLAVACAVASLSIRRWGLRGGAISLAILGALATLPTYVLVLFALGSEQPDQRVVSPDGRHVLVIDRWSQVIDPMWSLRVEQTGGPLARYWAAGCVNGDYLDLESVRWVSPDELAVRVRDSDGVEENRIRLKHGKPARIPDNLSYC